MTSPITRVRISNLGWSFLASKVPSDTPYLNFWWINLANILIRFVTRVKLKVYQISDILVHQGLRYGVSDGNFEVKKDQPKLDIRNLFMIPYVHGCEITLCNLDFTSLDVSVFHLHIFHSLFQCRVFAVYNPLRQFQPQHPHVVQVITILESQRILNVFGLGILHSAVQTSI